MTSYRKSLILAIAFIAVIACRGSEPSPSPTMTSDQDNQIQIRKETHIKQYASTPPMTIDPTKSYTANLHTTKGIITIALNADEAPVTVNNFVFLAEDGFYNGVIFHRIIKGFMIQSGDPWGTGSGGPGYRFPDEPVTRDYLRGTIAMANAGPNTNGSQFFIMHEDGSLPKNYTIFGMVTKGLDVLDKIAATPVGTNSSGELSQPLEEIVIETISIVKNSDQ